MDNVPLVKAVQTLQDLPHNVSHQRLLERTVDAQERGHRPSGCILQEDIQKVVVQRRI